MNYEHFSITAISLDGNQRKYFQFNDQCVNELAKQHLRADCGTGIGKRADNLIPLG